MTKIIPGPVVTVVTEKTTFKAKKLILTAGPWTNKLLQPTGLTLPLTVRASHVASVTSLSFSSHKESRLFIGGQRTHNGINQMNSQYLLTA